MKKCPYCETQNADDANACRKCFAGFPPKILQEDTKEISESEETTKDDGENLRNNRRKKKE